VETVGEWADDDQKTPPGVTHGTQPHGIRPRPHLLSVASALDAGYRERMAKAKEFDFSSSCRATKDEDEKTLAAIDEGIRDAETARTTPIEEVRKRLHKWSTTSLSRIAAKRSRQNSDF
jgi:predicted transcriptional regulator